MPPRRGAGLKLDAVVKAVLRAAVQVLVHPALPLQVDVEVEVAPVPVGMASAVARAPSDSRRAAIRLCSVSPACTRHRRPLRIGSAMLPMPAASNSPMSA